MTADWLVLELHMRGSEFVRFNSEDYPTAASLTWAVDDAELAFGEHRLKRSQISAVWWRRMLPPHMPEHLPEPEARWAAGQASAAIDGFWRTVDAHWVNRPLSNAAAGNKIEQLARAAAAGFDVPPSVVSNDAAVVHAFLRRHQRAICKPLGEAVVPRGDDKERGTYGVFYTTPVALDDVADIADFGPEPYLFQALIPKRYDVRVTVIGDSLWACRIDSQSVADAEVDWRLGETVQLRHTVEELPRALSDRCIELTRSYGLRYSAIDLARRSDDGYAFFELNPNGQWAWVEQLTGLPLRARLADELLQTA